MPKCGRKPACDHSTPYASGSHVGIVRSAAAFRYDPIDVLARVLDVAGLAVNAVLGVDLQPRPAGLAGDDLVDSGRTVVLLRRVVERQVDVDGDRRVLQPQMDRLV